MERLQLEWASGAHLVQPHQLKQGNLEQVAQDHVQMAFECLQGWRFLNLPRQPVPVLSQLHSEKVLPNVQTGPLVFQFVTIASCPATAHH